MRPISRSSARAATAPAAPIGTAHAVIVSTRRLSEKSPR